MHKYFKIFAFIFIILITNNLKSEETKIVYVDVQSILENSNVGKKAFDNLNDLIKKNKNNFVEIENQLKSEENEILKQKNIISENELNAKISDFQNKINDYNLKKQKFTKEVNDQRLNVTNNLLKSLNLILSDYASKNEISIILQKKNIIIGKSTLDVTKDVLKIFNENIKTIN
jgi:outer membrane protein